MSVRREMTRKLRAMGHSAAKDKDGARVYPGGRAGERAGRQASAESTLLYSAINLRLKTDIDLMLVFQRHGAAYVHMRTHVHFFS